MKKTIILLFITLVTLSFKSSSNMDIDKELVGSWKGFEKDKQFEGVEKHWIQHRFKDGTFIIMFTSISEGCDVKTFSEKGKWWVADGKFYEKTKFSKNPDVYNYEITDGLMVKFTKVSSDKKFNEEDYTFTEYKIEAE